MKKIVIGIMTVIGSVQADVVTNVTANSTYMAAGANSAVNFDGFDFLGVRGDLASAVAQYSVMEFDLASQQIENAALRLRGYSNATPAAWGTPDNVPIQIVVLSPNNTAFAESTATYNNQATGIAWKKSDNSDAANLFVARDTGPAEWTTYNPGASWASDAWYDIALSTAQMNVLESLRAAGETSALIYIQVQNGTPGSEANTGVRFYSDDSAFAPELVMQTIPEPATLGLVAVMGGAALFIRRRFMI